MCDKGKGPSENGNEKYSDRVELEVPNGIYDGGVSPRRTDDGMIFHPKGIITDVGQTRCHRRHVRKEIDKY